MPPFDISCMFQVKSVQIVNKLNMLKLLSQIRGIRKKFRFEKSI